MEKRFIIFIVISFVILAVWQIVLERFYPRPQRSPNSLQQVTKLPEQHTAPQHTNDQKASEPVADSTAEVHPQLVTVDTPLWRAVFDNRGAVLRSFVLKALPNGRPLLNSEYGQLEVISEEGLKRVGAPLRLAVANNAELSKKLNESLFEIDAPASEISVSKEATTQLSFKLRDASGTQVKKTFKFYGGKYTFDAIVEASHNGQPLDVNLLIGPNFGDQSVKKIDTYINTPQQAVIEHSNGQVEYVTAASLEHSGAAPDTLKEFSGGVDWIAACDHYFVMTLIAPKELPRASIRNDFYTETAEGEQVYKHQLSIEIPVLNGEQYTVFVGPKDHNLLLELSAQFKGRVDMEALIDYGIFSFMVRPFIPLLDILLKLFYKLTGNYGWAIVILTFVINMLLFPLRWKSSVAMKKTIKIQPRMKQLQDEMKKLKPNDPRMQEIQMEQMKLMREGNPLTGCLPLLLQMPIFWAFFVFLSISIDIRHSPFIFWIKDLAAPDRTWILPILMTIAMMASTFLSPTPDDPAQRVQKYFTSFVMPIIFLIFFFANAPSGLVLYWMFSSIVSVAQQLVINKMTEEPEAEKLAPVDKAKRKEQARDLANAR